MISKKKKKNDDIKDLYFRFHLCKCARKKFFIRRYPLEKCLRTKNMKNTEKNIFYNNQRHINFELNRI